MFIISGGFVPQKLYQFVPFACGAERLTFGLHAAEIPASERWKQEFSEISSQTIPAMSLSTEELQALVVRCEELRTTLEGLEETPRKIYLKRLEKTKALFDFVIESRMTDTE